MMDLRPYKKTGTQLSDFLPWAALIAPGVVLNKDGAFQRTMAFRGPDLDSSTPSELMGASARLNNAFRRLGSGWCLHVEARRAPAPGYPDSVWPDALSWLIDEERRAVFEAAGARFESAYFFTLTWLPPAERQTRLESFLFEGAQDGAAATASSVHYRQHLDRFTNETDQILALMETLAPEARWLGDEDTLTYLHDCVSDRPHRVAKPETPFHLDALLTDAPLVGGLAPRLGRHHLRVISVRSFVTETEPGFLDALNRLAISYRWVSRFIPLDREEARRELEKTRKRWFSKRKGLLTLLREALFKEEALLVDNDAANQAADADTALQELGADAVSAGYATLTITVADASEDMADDAVRQIQQIADGLGFVTQVESVNAVEAWLGSLPGQAYADARRPILLSPSLAHLLPLSAVWAGPHRNAHLNGPPLMLTATDGATPFRLDLHVGDVGHAMIVGPTGAGKSVLLATLAAQWLRYASCHHAGAQVYLFDKGRSCRATILGLGGDFFDLGEADALELQPLECVNEPEERAWAQDWLVGLIASANVTVTPDVRTEVWRVLELLADRPVEDRTLTLFAALMQNQDVRAALHPFTQGGAHGRLIDHDRSTLGYGAVQAFEMDDVLRRPEAAGAVLGALFHALEKRFDGRPTMLVLDEAWLFLKDAFFTAQIQDWLKTLRKRNVAVVFARGTGRCRTLFHRLHHHRSVPDTVHVVEVSPEGQVLNVRAASGEWRASEAQTAYHLGRFVRLVRALPTDGVVLRENWLEAYKFLTPPAAAQLTEIARADDPFLSLGRVGRTVHIRSIIQRSDRSWEVSWIERETNATGSPDGEAYSGVFTVTTRRPRTADEIATNPLGLLISEFSWSRVR